MRRSENRGEPRETFASNSRDSQDFEIFSFLSFPLLSLSPSLPLLLSSHSSEHPHLRPRLFYDRFATVYLYSSTPLLDPCPAIDGKVRRSKWLSDFLSFFHTPGSLTFLVLAPATQPNATSPLSNERNLRRNLRIEILIFVIVSSTGRGTR